MSVPDGFANEGWLNKLKKSARNRKLCCSVMWNVLPSVKSTFFCGGPIIQFRGAVPYPVASLLPPVDRGIGAAGVYANGFTQLASFADMLP